MDEDSLSDLSTRALLSVRVKVEILCCEFRLLVDGWYLVFSSGYKRRFAHCVAYLCEMRVLLLFSRRPIADLRKSACTAQTIVRLEIGKSNVIVTSYYTTL